MDKDKGSALSGVLEMDLSAVVVIEAFDAFGKGLRLREGGTTDQCRKDKDHDEIGFHAGDLLLRPAEPGMVNDKWALRLLSQLRKRRWALVFHGQQAHEVFVTHATAGVAVEGEGPDLTRHKLNELAFPGEDGSAI